MPRSITGDEHRHLEKHGYAVIPDFLSAEELAEVVVEVDKHLPPWEEFTANRQKYSHIARHPFDWIEFPFKGRALNHLAVSPEIMSFVQTLLGTSDLHMAFCLLWPKYAGTHEFEQGLHVDYRTHMLVTPRDDGRFRFVPFILYLTDVTIDLGPTWIASQEVTGRSFDVVNGPMTPAARPDAYEQQIPVVAKAGTLLVYSMRTFHRGSAITADKGHRFTYNFTYRAADCPWGWRMWGQDAQRPEMQEFLHGATPEQRSVFGFPAPSSDYWNEQTLSEVAMRYPDIDMEPYRNAAGHADRRERHLHSPPARG